MFTTNAAHIFGASGSISEKVLPKQKHESSLYLAADGGLRLTKKAGITPDIFIGDFDSLDKNKAKSALDESTEVMSYPCEKDDTDTMLAIKLALKKGFRNFCLYGCLGGDRPDHTLASLQGLSYIAENGGQGFAFGAEGNDGLTPCITVIKNGSMKFPPDMQGYFSVLADGGDCSGVTLKGCKYTLENGKLLCCDPMGVSNSFIPGNSTEIRIGNGRATVIFYI